MVINEFLAENDGGLADAAGHRHDWIELKNIGATTEDVSGWHLTDNASVLKKWEIPVTVETTNLAPGETLLVFASGDNGEVGVVGDELHANFQLSQEPGYLALVMEDGATVAHAFNLYPQQNPNVSFGLGVGVDATATETLLSAGTAATGDGSPAQFRPFTGINASVDDHWTEIGYAATAGDGWISTTNGLGFEYGSPWQDSTVSLSGQIAGYVRMPFTVTDAAQLTSLSLNLRVDNGYVVYLNGREVQRERIPTTFKIGNDWLDSKQNGGLNARQNLDNTEITGSPAVFDLTPWLDTIEEGQNVLAIYAANHTSDQGDYLVHAELTAGRAVGALTATFMATPTPGLENGAGYLGVIEDTVFSHDRDFYDAPFSLTLSAIASGAVVVPGATVRYTTDGTRPTLTNGLTYTGPITVDPATLSYADAGVVTVRAAAFKEGYVSSNVDTQSYIFLDEVLNQDGVGLPTSSSWGNSGPDWEVDPNIVSLVGAENLKADLKSIPTMSLVMDWEEFFGDGTTGDGAGIYPQIDDWREKSDERYASLEYFTEGRTENFQVDAKVEIQGHSSTIRQDGNWRSDKLSLEVKFKQPYDTGLHSETLFGNAVNAGENVANDFDSLILDAQYNYTFTVNDTTKQGPYATYIHDQVVADLQNLAGGEAPHGRWVHLYINGMYWGIYNAHERPTDAFAEEYYGGDKDDYLVVKGFEGINLLHGGTQGKYQQADGGVASQVAYQALLDQVNDNLASLTEYQQVADLLDIDSFIDYMVVLLYAGNYDWGRLNWIASVNAVDPNGQWRFHSWDQEHAFPTDQNGTGSVTNSDPNYDHFLGVVIDDFGNHEYGPTGIHHMLMNSEEYRLRFSDRVQELLRNDGLLTPANAQAVWQARVDELSSAINAEAARWGDNRTPDKTGDTWATNVQYTSDHFFFANGPYQSRTDTLIDIFNSTSSLGVGKIDWLVNLDAPGFNQYGGAIDAPFNLLLTNPNTGGTVYYTLDGTDPRDPGGAISASAIAYAGGPISLTDATRVRARVYDATQSGVANDWSAEVDKQFLLADPLSLRIVELMYNPVGADLEYIELQNIGTQQIDLAGVQLADFSTGGYAFASQTLAPGERIVVPESVVAFQAAYPTVTNVTATAYSGSLSNGGEAVTLIDSHGRTLQSFTYDDAAPWPSTPDGGGPSLEYVGPIDADLSDPSQVAGDPYDDAANWLASLTAGGTPGTGRAIPGDYDGNGSVEQADYAVWRSTYRSTTDLRADGNNDNVVDASDYAIWRSSLAAASRVALSTQTASPASAVEAPEASSTPTPEVAAVSTAMDKKTASPLLAVDTNTAWFAKTGADAILLASKTDSLATDSQDELLLLLAVDQLLGESSPDAPPLDQVDSEEAAEIAFTAFAEDDQSEQLKVTFAF